MLKITFSRRKPNCRILMKANDSLRLLRAILLFTVGLAVSELHSATLTVTATSDSGAGSLRQAIVDANANPGDDTIEIMATGTIVLSSPLPQITGNTVLSGPGTNLLTISGNNAVRLFTIRSGTTNVFNGISLASGLATNGANGAAIENAGELTLMNCVVANNNTYAGLGGGIYNSGNLTLLNSMIASNSVTGGDGFGGDPSSGRGGGGGGLGGGFFTATGTVVISNVTFYANRATGGSSGGGTEGNVKGAHGGGPNGGIGGVLNVQAGDGSPGGFGGGGGGGAGNLSSGRGGDGGFGGGGGGQGTGSGVPAKGEGGFGGGAGSWATFNGLPVSGYGGGGGGLGGGMFVQTGVVALWRCSIFSNAAVGGNAGPSDSPAQSAGAEGGGGLGGGVFSGGGALAMRECLVGDNQASAGAGGIGYYSGRGGQAGGAGVFLLDTSAEITSSTFTSNRVVGGA
jgi:hypothetical protein